MYFKTLATLGGLVRMHTVARTGCPSANKSALPFLYSKMAICVGSIQIAQPIKRLSSLSRENDLMGTVDQPILISSASDLPLPPDAIL
jgi:hypothetical protein